ATLYEQGYEVDLGQYLTRAEFNGIVPALKTLGPDAKLKEIFDLLQEAYDYLKIRLAMAIYKRQSKTCKQKSPRIPGAFCIV
ncbi:helix-turn-helix domain-containing protein, partial [Salmonella sp. SAL4358]|uniref:helix-turn-helix domain-containing protein n=1 Tax=Salmonella sp. SAL4358 TaxID=3159879 RepID=UPI00397D1C0B